jgi:hypothetical protein
MKHEKEIMDALIPSFEAAMAEARLIEVQTEIRHIFEREQLSGIQAAGIVFPLIAYAVKLASHGDAESEAEILEALSKLLAYTRVRLVDCCLRMKQGDGKGHSLDCPTQMVKEQKQERGHE